MQSLLFRCATSQILLLASIAECLVTIGFDRNSLIQKGVFMVKHLVKRFSFWFSCCLLKTVNGVKYVFDRNSLIPKGVFLVKHLVKFFFFFFLRFSCCLLKTEYSVNLFLTEFIDTKGSFLSQALGKQIYFAVFLLSTEDSKWCKICF